MKRYFRRAAPGYLLFLSLLLIACGGDNTATPAQTTPVTATTASSQTTTASTTIAPAADTSATATPVVLANLPSPTAGRVTSLPAVTAVAPAPTSGLAVRPTTTTAAIPTYSPAALSAFDLKSSANVGLNQKTAVRLSNLAGLPLLLDAPGTEGGLAVVASSWKIAPPLLWCEDTAANLDKIWPTFSFNLKLDDQAVDLKNFQTVNFEDSGVFCRTLDIVISTTPTGVHRLLATRTVAQEVDSGILKGKLPAGDYSYQLVMLSVAPNSNSPQNAKLSDFKLGTSSGANALYPRPAQSFTVSSDTIEQFKPGTFKYTAVVPANQSYALLGGWCAKDLSTLNENWKKMTYSASINGQAVDLKNVPTLDNQQNSQTCRLWDLNMTVPEGQHQIIIKLNFSGDTNDGNGTYSAGDYISQYTVLSLQLNP